MNHMSKAVLALVLAGVAAGASAHRAWMIPSTSMVEAKEAWVTIDGAISEGLFDYDHMPLRMEALSVTDPDGIVGQAPAPVQMKRRSSVDLKLPKDGTYRIALVSNNVMGSYTVGGETRRFRGSEAAFAKEVPAGAKDVRITVTHARVETYVSANKPSDGALKPTGVGLELVPLTNPTELHTGDTARWRFQLDGKALPNFPFSLTPGGVRFRGVAGEIRLVTDARGEVNVTLPEANRYWISAAYPANAAKGPAPADAPARVQRYSYSGTLEILPE
jgi:uncharacterized GH25 family protein